jgi:hypothetical protein
MNRKQILKLRPEFKFNGIRMTDWFEITESAGFISIRSGLRHADGQTKSPYYYEDFTGGKHVEKKALEKFNEWWNLTKENLTILES